MKASQENCSGSAAANERTGNFGQVKGLKRQDVLVFYMVLVYCFTSHLVLVPKRSPPGEMPF